MKPDLRKFTILALLLPLFLACSTQIEGEKAGSLDKSTTAGETISPEGTKAKTDPEKMNNFAKMEKLNIDIPESADPGIYLYNNPATRSHVLGFYNKVTGNPVVSQAIAEMAVENNIPFTLAFSLAHAESDFFIWAVNENSSSVDRGIFQINSLTFPDIKPEEAFNPYVNAKAGLGYLRWCLDLGGNDIVALAMYNAGSGRVQYNAVPRITLDHINNIIDYRSDLDRQFTEWVEKLETKKIDSKKLALAK